MTTHGPAPGGGPSSARGLVGCWSHDCSWHQLAEILPSSNSDREQLDLSGPWAQQWTVAWRTTSGEVVAPASELGAMPSAGLQLMRQFTWSKKQQHRPSLEYMGVTTRHHGAESGLEANLLLALEFAGDLIETLSQPIKLTYRTHEGRSEHTPDFLAITRTGQWLIDVRPERRLTAKTLIDFAATAEVTLAAGWRYAAVIGWHPYGVSVLRNFAAERRPLSNVRNMIGQVLSTVEEGPRLFAEIAEATSYPVIARAYTRHLLWHRRLSIELGAPFGDATMVYRVEEQPWS